MNKYFFKVSYNGSAYQGWQNQKDVLSVQEVIESTLTKVFKKSIKIVGCGRTDAGVHAENYFFHVYLPQNQPELIFKLNKLLPDQIAVKDLFLVENDQNAQKDAALRIYTYYFHLKKDPQINTFSTWYPYKSLNLIEMNKAAALISTATDFYNFCISPEKHKSTICNVQQIEIIQSKSKQHFAIRFKGDRYIRSMIRLLVGELIEIGLGHTSIQEFESYLNRTAVKPKHHKAFPQGLHLTTVLYPFIEENPDDLDYHFKL